METTRPVPRMTYHLVPREIWEAVSPDEAYAPESLATEGFIHCTDGLAEVVATGNRYYREDPRPYLVVTIDRARVSARVRYDDPGGRFPHIYGALNRDAVVSDRTAPRSSDGTFLPLT